VTILENTDINFTPTSNPYSELQKSSYSMPGNQCSFKFDCNQEAYAVNVVFNQKVPPLLGNQVLGALGLKSSITP
jgi:hypothetical protein